MRMIILLITLPLSHKHLPHRDFQTAPHTLYPNCALIHNLTLIHTPDIPNYPYPKQQPNPYPWQASPWSNATPIPQSNPFIGSTLNRAQSFLTRTHPDPFIRSFNPSWPAAHLHLTTLLSPGRRNWHLCRIKQNIFPSCLMSENMMTNSCFPTCPQDELELEKVELVLPPKDTNEIWLRDIYRGGPYWHFHDVLLLIVNSKCCIENHL